MRHEDAIETEAAERYLLGEMTDDEQGIFEEHFFDCAVCAADVTDGTRMMIAGRAMVKEEREAAKAPPSNVVPMPKRKPWSLPVAAAASLAFTLLGGQAGYLVALRQQHAPTELVRVAQIDTGTSRSGTPAEIPAVRPGDGMRFDVEPRDEAVRYAAIVTCGGKTQSSHSISREMAANAVTLRLGDLPAGRCELVVEGVRKDGKRIPITSSPFEVGERRGVR